MAAVLIALPGSLDPVLVIAIGGLAFVVAALALGAVRRSDLALIRERRAEPA
jgi:hypothetical protein